MMAKDRHYFVRLSLNYADHPKIEPLSDAAFRAHVEMILYSRRYQTDGLIPKRIAKRWLEPVLDELAHNDTAHPSLTRLDNGDYMIYGYEEMQETREDVQRKHQVNVENGRRGGLAKATASAKRLASGSVPRRRSENVAEIEIETDVRKQVVPETSHVSASQVSSEIADAIPRPDITRLLDLLDSEIEANGAKKPQRTKRNVDACRLLLDRDGHTPDQVAACIRWCQADEFWRSNILSMSKLRQKYDQLRLDAQRQRAPAQTPTQRAIATAQAGARVQAEIDATTRKAIA